MASSPFGYLGNEAWRDMSDFLVHFTTDLDALTTILAGGSINPGRFGAAKGLGSPYLPPQESACLSEIPLGYLQRLVDRHGQFGIGFRKLWLTAQGATRVWYLDQGTPAEQLVVGWVAGGGGSNWEQDRIYQLAPFIDYVGTFGGKRHEFEWEREWRVLGGLTFSPDDVVFLFAPEAAHHGLDPPPGSVLIDALWDFDHLQAVIAPLQ